MPDTAPPARAHVRDLFLRLMGLVFLAAFLSLLVQVTALVGDDGLLPARDFLARAGGVLGAPTVFGWIGTGDRVLRGAAVAGAAVSVALACNLAPRWCLLFLWALYLSFVTIGQDFFAFQWDNLLLEAAVLGVLLAPAGSGRGPRRRRIRCGGLALWLLFRLHVESGLAKLLLGDPSWRDLTALATYYETAPLPTWVGWWAHQMPMAAHRATALFTYTVELVLPLWLLGRAALRVAAFAGMVGMQLAILLTANYGFFNYLSLAICLFALDDGTGLGDGPPRPPARPTPPRVPSTIATAGMAAPPPCSCVLVAARVRAVRAAATRGVRRPRAAPAASPARSDR
jgi:hypothetical protein